MLRTQVSLRLARVAVALVLAAAATVVATAAPTDLFDEIHARVKAADATRRTIRARFTQTTVSSLLVKPAVSKGTVLAEKPAQLVMTYTVPERKTIAMDGTRVVAKPERGPVEQTDVTEVMKKVNHYFVNATPVELRKSFTVRAFDDPEMKPAAWQIDLVPRRKQIRQGLEHLQVWIVKEPLQLAQIRMTFPGGDSDTITIEDAQVNVAIPPGAFEAGVAPAGKKK
jgi:outer membrane lipoprotein-sorting protein